jgi:hypothetical protein
MLTRSGVINLSHFLLPIASKIRHAGFRSYQVSQVPSSGNTTSLYYRADDNFAAPHKHIRLPEPQEIV